MANGGTIRRAAIPPPVRIRRNIKSLDIRDPIIVFFSRAIERMKALPLDNPLSWRYQAAIHDYPSLGEELTPPPSDRTVLFNMRRIDPNNLPNTRTTRGTFDRDPFADIRDNLPSPSDRVRFWRQCQHSSWFFLPWHRMYLHFFEKIVADQVLQLKSPEWPGPGDWALPYWDWTASDGDGRIPTQCRNPTFPDGSRNFLFVAERNAAPAQTGPPPTPRQNANLGDQIASARQMDKAFRCLTPSQFAGKGQFGGPRIRLHGGEGPPEPQPAQNSDLDGFGILEGTPHGSMHVATGGLSQDGKAWMSQFTQAALDPIFWMHHCNIDRLWEAWIQRDKKNQNADESGWLGPSPGFAFHNASGGVETMTPKQVVQSRKAPLSYEYDDTSDPLSGP